MKIQQRNTVRLQRRFFHRDLFIATTRVVVYFLCIVLIQQKLPDKVDNPIFHVQDQEHGPLSHHTTVMTLSSFLPLQGTNKKPCLCFEKIESLFQETNKVKCIFFFFFCTFAQHLQRDMTGLWPAHCYSFVHMRCPLAHAFKCNHSSQTVTQNHCSRGGYCLCFGIVCVFFNDLNTFCFEE